MTMVHIGIVGISPRAFGLAFALLLGCMTALSGPAIAQTFTLFPMPVANSQPNGIAAGRNGNLWFTESDGGKIGRITPAGVITEFSLPVPPLAPWPAGS